MKRRNFLRTAGLLTLPAFGSWPAAYASVNSPLREVISAKSENILVIVQLFGGNDGLNTLIPLDQQDGLHAVRPALVMPTISLLPLNDTLSMHGSMSGMKQLFTEEQLSIIQSVGYPQPNRSHFRSSEIWATASESDVEVRTGWVGRYLDTNHPAYPQGYPNELTPDPLCVTVGNVAHASCEGKIANYSQAILDPSRVTFLEPNSDTPLPGGHYGDQLDFMRTAFELTNTYGRTVQEAANRGRSTAEYPDTHIGNQLQYVAQMITGGLGTKVYTVNMGGFDTHADQVVGGENTTGSHASLLQELSDAIKVFQQDMVKLDYGKRVLGMTYSEFGRRIVANASLGTDHGDAGPMFLFGECVRPQVLGDNVVVDPETDISDGVPMQFDFRDVYASILIDWFGATPAAVAKIIRPNFVRLPIIRDCTGVSTATDPSDPQQGDAARWFVGNPYPNPTRGNFSLKVRLPTRSSLELWVRDIQGRVAHHQRFDLGRPQTVSVTLKALPPGQYTVHTLLGKQHHEVSVLTIN